MKTLDDIRSKVRIARASGTFVVLTVEEAESLFAAIDDVPIPGAGVKFSAPQEGGPLERDL